VVRIARSGVSGRGGAHSLAHHTRAGGVPGDRFVGWVGRRPQPTSPPGWLAWFMLSQAASMPASSAYRASRAWHGSCFAAASVPLVIGALYASHTSFCAVRTNKICNCKATVFASQSQRMITLEAQIREAERELQLRQRVYPRWVHHGKLNRATAEHRLQCQAAITSTLWELLRSGGSGQGVKL